jgi:hypothetical protein
MSVTGGFRWIAHASGMVGMTSPGGCQLEQTLDGTNRRPLASDLVEASQQELPETSGLFGPSEHEFNDLLTHTVAAAPASEFELHRHGVCVPKTSSLSTPDRVIYHRSEMIAQVYGTAVTRPNLSFRYTQGTSPRDKLQRWKTFLQDRADAVASIDMFLALTISFPPL